MHEHELRALLDGPFGYGALGRDGRQHALDALGPGHLEPVRAEVVEGAGSEQLVERGDEVGEVGHSGSNARMPHASGRGAAW